MPIVEKISEMQKQGLGDAEIVQRLREEGISPREINEALEQSKVKSAVFGNTSEMEPSLMESSGNNILIPTPSEKTEQSAETYPLTEQEIYPPVFSATKPTRSIEESYPQPYPLEIPTEQIGQELPESYPESTYPSYPQYQEYSEYQAPQVLDTDIVTEVAEQIINEKIQKTEKQITEIAKAKIEIQGKINNMEERLRRIEIIIDKLQLSILKEIGSYGKDIAELKSEMETTQESFSKILSPLSENIQELRKITSSVPSATKTTNITKKKEKTETKIEKSKKRGNGFEDYLRG